MMMRISRLVTFTLLISALLLTSSLQTFARTARAQNSNPQSRMYCIGFGASDHLYRVDNYDTAPTAVDLGSTGLRLTDIAITPNGTGYVITVTKLYKIDLENGKTTLVPGITFPTSQNSLEAASDDRLFVWGSGDKKIRSINLASQPAKLEELGIELDQYGADLALAPGGIDLYGTTLDGNLIKINLFKRTWTTIGALKNFQTNYMSGLGFASDGQLYGTRGSNTTGLAQVWKINVCNGEATLVGDIAGASQLGNGGMAMRR